MSEPQIYKISGLAEFRKTLWLSGFSLVKGDKKMPSNSHLARGVAAKLTGCSGRWQ
jgi:hypothetical protein